jgi:hypothetical protein
MPNPNFHDDNTNESVLLAIDNPLASTARLRFSHLGGNNNWWWAIDNIQVSAVPEPGSYFLAIAAIGAVGCAGRKRRRS